MNTKTQDTALLLVRLIVAAIFLQAGIAKIGMWSAPPAAMPAGMLNLLRFLAIVEPLGAIGLIVGCLTRWAATGLAIIMVGAVLMMQFTMHIGFSTATGTGWNFPLMTLAGCIALMAFGAGRLSIDAAWRKK